VTETVQANTFGKACVTHAMFPVAPQRDPDSDVLAMTGMDTLELVSRLQRSGGLCGLILACRLETGAASAEDK